VWTFIIFDESFEIDKAEVKVVSDGRLVGSLLHKVKEDFFLLIGIIQSARK